MGDREMEWERQRVEDREEGRVIERERGRSFDRHGGALTQCIYLLIEKVSIAADERGVHFEPLPLHYRCLLHYPCLLHQVIERPGDVVPLLVLVVGVMVTVVVYVWR